MDLSTYYTRQQIRSLVRARVYQSGRSESSGKTSRWHGPSKPGPAPSTSCSGDLGIVHRTGGGIGSDKCLMPSRGASFISRSPRASLSKRESNHERRDRGERGRDEVSAPRCIVRDMLDPGSRRDPRRAAQAAASRGRIFPGRSLPFPLPSPLPSPDTHIRLGGAPLAPRNKTRVGRGGSIGILGGVQPLPCLATETAAV